MAPTGTDKPAGGWSRRVNILLGVLLGAYAVSDHPFYGGYPGFGAIQAGILIVGAAAVLAGFAANILWNQRLVLVLVSSLFTLGVTEVATEFLFSAQLRPTYEYDAERIFRLAANQAFAKRLHPENGGGFVLSRTNAAGYRGPPLQTDSRGLRVVVYGDSFIHAAYTEQAQTFVQQLEDELGRTLTSPVEVINGGVSAYGPDQNLLRLPKELPTLKPDLVVFAIFAGNDFGDLLRNKLFKLGPNGELERNDFELEQNMRAALELNQRGSILKHAAKRAMKIARARATPLHTPAKPDPFANVERSLDSCQQEYEDYLVRGSNLVTNTHMDTPNIDICLRPKSASARYKVALMNAILDEVAEECKRAGVPVVFLFIPLAMDVMGGHDYARVDRERYPEYAPTRLTDTLASHATEKGLPHLDLFETFRSNEPKALFLGAGDVHWNAKGQALSAKALRDYLLDTELIEVASN